MPESLTHNKEPQSSNMWDIFVTLFVLKPLNKKTEIEEEANIYDISSRFLVSKEEKPNKFKLLL